MTAEWCYEIAVFRTTWLTGDNLVFHGRREDHETGEHFWLIRSRCGLILEETRDGRDVRHSVFMDRALADKIARPCKRCWPP